MQAIQRLDLPRPRLVTHRSHLTSQRDASIAPDQGMDLRSTDLRFEDSGQTRISVGELGKLGEYPNHAPSKRKTVVQTESTPSFRFLPLHALEGVLHLDRKSTRLNSSH